MSKQERRDYEPNIDTILNEASGNANFWELLKEFGEGQKTPLGLYQELEAIFRVIRSTLKEAEIGYDATDEHELHPGAGV